ncbi:hypothetical protein BBJ28_00026386 [Nothophytophthora sp. Chile5]|nr:hypothetical protein BBJ28_00026386 [Nothophytophthora sp. Chile5]
MAEVAPARRKKSLLVDGNNMLYHVFDPLSTVERLVLAANECMLGVCAIRRNVRKTGALDGLFYLLQRLDQTHRPEHISVVFDSAQLPTVRKLEDPAYKSDRSPTPPFLRAQFRDAREALDHVHGSYIVSPGFEADDIIASYSAQHAAAGFDVLIVSNDNDCLQLAYDFNLDAPDASVGDSDDAPSSDSLPPATVELYQPMKRRYIRERNLKGRFELRARLIPDLQALCGHRWGKIPKVDNMTDKLALELLTRYGGLFAMLRQLDTIEDLLLRKTLQRSISSIERSHRMVKLQTDIALPVAIEGLQRPQLSERPHNSSTVDRHEAIP